MKSVTLAVLPDAINPGELEAALQVLVIPYDSAVTPLGPARAFALRGIPRADFGANKFTRRARHAPMPRSEGTDSEKTETVLTKAREGLGHDHRQTTAKRIKIEAQTRGQSAT